MDVGGSLRSIGHGFSSRGTGGASWGPMYGLVALERDVSPVATGLALGTGVWAAAYAALVPLGIYGEPWRYPPQELALDPSYHVVYGLGVATAYAALAR